MVHGHAVLQLWLAASFGAHTRMLNSLSVMGSDKLRRQLQFDAYWSPTSFLALSVPSRARCTLVRCANPMCRIARAAVGPLLSPANRATACTRPCLRFERAPRKQLL
eukprot:scaffold72594_cov30-Tisochrysis_lutea.AAC.2